MKRFIFASLILAPFVAISTPQLYPGYLGDGVSPAWAIDADKWYVSINDRSSRELFKPALHVTCYVEKKKPDFCFSPDYDPNPGNAACVDLVSPGLDLGFSFNAHPDDPKPKYAYSPLGLFRLLFRPTFIDRSVKVSTGSDEFFETRFTRSAASVFANEDYRVSLDRPDGRHWLYNFTHSSQKKLNIDGENIKIEAHFRHQDLEKWLNETLEKCP